MQLLYHASKAREEKCAFVDELQWVCKISLYHGITFVLILAFLAYRPHTVNIIVRFGSSFCSAADEHAR